MTTEQAGFLVLADPFCAGWHAEVDREARRVLRANHAQRAEFLGPGEHDVWFSLRRRSLLVASVLAVLSCVVSLPSLSLLEAARIRLLLQTSNHPTAWATCPQGLQRQGPEMRTMLSKPSDKMRSVVEATDEGRYFI